MKRKQITAILMSAIMTVSACMPMNSISAMAADKAGAGATEVAAEAVAAQESAAAVQEAEAEPQNEPASEPQQEPAVEPMQPETTEIGDTDSEDKKDDPDETSVNTDGGQTGDGELTGTGETAEESGINATSETAATDEPAMTDEPAADPAADSDEVDPAADPDAVDSAAVDPADKEETDEKVKAGKPAKKAGYMEFGSAVSISPGDSVEVSVTAGSPYYIFKFVPDKSGVYRFYSTSNEDTYVTLYDEITEQLATSDDSSDANFDFEYEYRKGNTYYFQTQQYSGDYATYTVHLEAVDVHTLDVEGDMDESVAVTCSPQNGAEQITLSVIAESDYDITYRWTDVMGEEVGTDSSYTFKPYNNSDYYCTISDGNDTFEKRFHLYLNHFVVVGASADDPTTPFIYTAEYGQTTQLSADIWADDMSQLYYEWSEGYLVNESGIYWSSEKVATGNGLSSIETEAVTGPRYYKCNVNDQYGNSAEIFYNVYVENNFKAYVITDPDNIDVNQRYASLECVQGEDVTFKVGVQAADMTGITYKWSNFGDVIDGATSNEYTLQNVYGDEDVVCTVTDKYGTAIECFFSFTSIIHPYIEDGYARDIYLDPGESTTLAPHFDTNIEDRLSYTWYCNNEVIPGETGETLALDGTALSGTYEVKAAYKDIYAYMIFRVTRNNNFNVRAKNSAAISVPAGASAELEVVATATDMEGITYQWYIVEDDEDDDVYTPIDGANTSKYTVPSVTSATSYLCTATDKYNTKDSVRFRVSVNNNLSVHIAGESSYTYDATIYVNLGDPARLEVEVSANDTSQLTYEWRMSIDEENIEMVQTPTGIYEFVPTRYTHVELTVLDQYGNRAYAYFYVYIDNALTVNPEVYTSDGGKVTTEIKYIGTQDYSLKVNVPYDEQVTLKANASVKNGDIHYTWLKNDEHDGYDSEYTTSVTTSADACYCWVDDDYGNHWTIEFDFYIDNQLVAYPEGAPGSDTRIIYAAPGSEVTLTTIVTALDMDGISYWWDYYPDYVDLNPHGNTATFTMVDRYVIVDCSILDIYNNWENVHFEIYPENHFFAYPENATASWDGTYSDHVYIDAEPGEELDLRVCASADNMDAISYHWGKNIRGTNNWGEYEYAVADIPEETDDTYHITANESTIYYCNVSDGYGSSKTITFDVSVSGLIAYPEGATEVDGMPSNRIAIAAESGGAKTLRVVTIAPENEQLTYKWSQGPLNDSGWWPLEQGQDSTTNELTINLDTAQRYLCVVSDTHGNQALSYFYVNVGGVRLTSNFGTPALVGDNSYVVKVPVKVGEETTLQAIPVGSSAEGLTFKWLGDEFDTIPGATGNSYTFTGGVGTRYQCRVTDANGVVSKLTFELQTDNELSAKCAIVKEDGTTENYEYQGIVVNANVGDTVTLAMNVSCLNDNHLRYEWVDNLGRQVGTAATCPVTVEGNGTYTGHVTDGYGNSVSVLFRVLTNNEALKDAVCTLSQTSYPFDGKPKRPEVTVVLNGRTLTPGVDYTVAYSKNVDPGTAAVIITGRTVEGTKYLFFTIGNMIQTPAADVDEIVVGVGATKTFNIEGCHTPLTASGVNAAIATATISEQTVSVKGVKVGTYELALTAASNDVYNEAQVTSKSGNPTITVKVVPAKTASVTAANANKGIKITWKKVTGATGYVIKRQAGSGEWKSIKTITSGSTLTYTDAYGNTNGTKYTYRVYAKAATGTSYLYRAAECYKVLRPTIKSVTNSASKKMTVKWAKNAKANGYQVQYSLKSNFSGAKSVSADKNSIVSKTIGGLTKGKKYYVRLRTYKKVGSKKYYSTWSATKTVVIKK